MPWRFFLRTFAGMKRHLLIGLLLLLLALSACHTPTREARRMVKRAYLLADTLPDSTARLIDSVLRMPASFSERERMDMALLQAEALFGDHGDALSPIMDDDFFDDRATLSTSPELERAAAYYARKKQYAKAAHAALYSGFVQQHYNEKEAAMQSFKDAEHYGKMVRASLTVAQAEYKMGKLLLDDRLVQEALVMLNNSINGFDCYHSEKAIVQNVLAVCYMVLGDYENAEISLQQSLFYARKSLVDKVKRKALNNYAVFFRLQGEYDQAIACLKLVAKETNLDDTELLLLNINLGNTYFETQKMDSAAFYYKIVDSLLPNTHVKMETKVSAYKSLSRFAENQEDNTAALQYWKQYNKWLNEIRDRQEQNYVYGIQQKYDYGILQKELDQKVIRRQRLIIVLSVTVALALLAFAISQIRLARIRKQEAEIKANLLRFMKQNEELTKQSEAVKKAHYDLEQKHLETENARQNLAYQVEEYKNAYEASDRNLSKALLKEHQVMQKMAVYLENKTDSASLEALKYSVLGNQEYWEAMLKAFDKQFPGMRKKLALQYPELTETEQKILLLSYVDASREDTAQLLDISIFMVDKLRTSVKKKMATSTQIGTEKA